MRNSVATLFIALGMLFFAACEEKADWTIQEGPQPELVVEASLTNEWKAHTVRLSLPMNSLHERALPARRAEIILNDSRRNFSFVEREDRPGTYYMTDSLQGVVNRVYSLVIRYQGRTYSAQSFMVPVTLLQEPVYESHPEEALYRYVPQESPEPAMEEVLLDWSEVPGFTQLPRERTSARLIFYTLESLDVNQLFAPDQQKVWFPKGAKIIRRKYSLNERQQAFARSLLMESDWRGGLFDVAKGNTLTNLSEGAIGYFAALTVRKDEGKVNP